MRHSSPPDFPCLPSAQAGISFQIRRGILPQIDEEAIEIEASQEHIEGLRKRYEEIQDKIAESYVDRMEKYLSDE